MQFARYMGIDPIFESDLLWIAEQVRQIRAVVRARFHFASVRDKAKPYNPLGFAL